jgi:hypothetical protein
MSLDVDDVCGVLLRARGDHVIGNRDAVSPGASQLALGPLSGCIVGIGQV